MIHSNIIKYLIFTFIISSLFGVVTYFLLSTRHQAILKTEVLHKLGILDNNWKILNEKKQYKMLSPSFLIDGIYKSMEGPKSSRYIRLSASEKLIWITGFEVIAVDELTNKEISKDFICHMNVDLNDVNYYGKFNLKERIGTQYPRLTSLSNGFVNFNFPVGYGVPIKGNDYLYVTTQALNHNYSKILKKIKHQVTVEYEESNSNLKPLMSKTVFIQLPYDKLNPFKPTVDLGTNQCIPVETKNHSYLDKNGNTLSGHWVIERGKHTYRSEINEQLNLKDSLRLHFSAIHVHPFATLITLFDKTENRIIFKSTIKNYKNKVGLIKVNAFSSIEGIWLYKNHNYELVLETNNTSEIRQDMMASMFLFFYDHELEEIIKTTYQ